jgi:holliday junction DNA helicase RuvA
MIAASPTRYAAASRNKYAMAVTPPGRSIEKPADGTGSHGWPHSNNRAFPGYNSASMIAHLRGKLLVKHPNQAIVEAGGVGYDVTISVPTFSGLPSVGGDVALHIHTHVREDALALYGFLHPTEKRLFEKLITVSGIGPKLAITILSGMAADEMVGAIRGNDIGRLTRIPGIGKKTAERMVLELRDKLPRLETTETPAKPAMGATEEDVLSALMNLGYPRPLAEKALSAAAKNGTGKSFEAMFREALAALSK